MVESQLDMTLLKLQSTKFFGPTFSSVACFPFPYSCLLQKTQYAQSIRWIVFLCCWHVTLLRPTKDWPHTLHFIVSGNLLQLHCTTCKKTNKRLRKLGRGHNGGKPISTVVLLLLPVVTSVIKGTKELFISTVSFLYTYRSNSMVKYLEEIASQLAISISFTNNTLFRCLQVQLRIW